ncbi:MAG: SnoaL-like protein [Gammaproteobacteria bacterium]|jgi:ketosteroid isomerase-like protein|nr:SnoaL-like protein [Gammaproteobacteria bacterium]
MNIGVALIGSLALATCGAALSANQSAGKGTVRAAIENRLHSVEAALARGDSAENITRMLYADNVMITEDAPGSMRGTPAAIKGVQEWLDALGPGGAKGCKYGVVGPTVESSETFSSYLSLHCRANPPVLKEDMDLRMIYVWQKLPQGWRVVLESVQSGKF